MEAPRKKSSKIVVNLKFDKRSGPRGLPLLNSNDDSEDPKDFIVRVADKTISSVSSIASMQEPLVIPLPQRTTNVDSCRDSDKAAADALIAESLSNGESATMSTMTIRMLDHKKPLLGSIDGSKACEAEKFKADITTSAQNIDVRSECYNTVPIENFGEAILRGMGWDGMSSDNIQATQVRPNRLGLGARARPLPPPATKERKPGGEKRVSKGNNGSWVKEADEKLEKQKLRIGDIVWLRDPRFVHHDSVQRAKVIKVSGVPGLNNIEVKLESSNKKEVVLRTNAVLVELHELETRPFIDNGRKRPRDLKSTSQNQGKHTRYENPSNLTTSRGVWVAPGIRVRYIGPGVHHREKGDVVAVSDSGLVEVDFDDAKRLKDVCQSYLETVVPSTDSEIVVVRGPLRMQRGRIYKKDRDREELCIKINGDRKTFGFDDVSAPVIGAKRKKY